MTNLHKLLSKLGACREAVEFANGKTLAEAWQQCERADWMLWLVGRMAGTEGWPSRQQVVLVCCAIAEDVLPLYEKRYPNDARIRKCIEVTRAWCEGKATIDEVRAARAAAYAAAADAADDAAAYATYAAADAADAAYAADDAAYAAYAADDARFSKLKEYADLVRRELKIPVEVVA